jgi:hypothetical protein
MGEFPVDERVEPVCCRAASALGGSSVWCICMAAKFVGRCPELGEELLLVAVSFPLLVMLALLRCFRAIAGEDTVAEYGWNFALEGLHDAGVFDSDHPAPSTALALLMREILAVGGGSPTVVVPALLTRVRVCCGTSRPRGFDAALDGEPALSLRCATWPRGVVCDEGESPKIPLLMEGRL